MARMLDYIYLKLVDRCLCHILWAESAETRWTTVIPHSDNMYGSGPETERSRCFWMQMMMCRHSILAANNDWMHCVNNC
jgi:hypothetical protein